MAAADVPVAAPATGSGIASSARWLGAILLTGFLLIGVAVPLAHATMVLVAVNQAAGSPPPALGDVGALLWRRRWFFLGASLPVALLVALGSVLFAVPGLIVSALFLFVPAVVLYERAAGWAALLRSLVLVKTDAVRVAVILLVACVVGAAAFSLADLVMPEGSRRILVFGRALVGDLLLILCLPLPALAAARLYIDLRQREGVDATTLAKDSRH